MSKCLPHLATRNEDLAREVLGFLCVLLFNANQTVQVKLTIDIVYMHSFLLTYFFSNTLLITLKVSNQYKNLLVNICNFQHSNNIELGRDCFCFITMSIRQLFNIYF